jgi:outer membrane protein
MKRTFASITLLVLVSIAVLAQSAPAASPTTPSSTVNPLANATGTKIAVIDMQGAIAGSNEGQRDLEALAKKFEPRRVELQKLNTDIEDSKKQLNVQGDKMSPDAHEALVKSIETKQKTLQRSAEDAQNEFQQQQNEIAQRILQKMAPVLTKYVADNNYGLILDASAPWPQGPVILATPPMDITKAVVDAYNAQSGVPAPARTTPSTGAAAKPTVTTPGAVKPTTTPAATTTKPATTTPPKQ